MHISKDWLIPFVVRNVNKVTVVLGRVGVIIVIGSKHFRVDNSLKNELRPRKLRSSLSQILENCRTDIPALIERAQLLEDELWATL